MLHSENERANIGIFIIVTQFTTPKIMPLRVVRGGKLIHKSTHPDVNCFYPLLLFLFSGILPETFFLCVSLYFNYSFNLKLLTNCCST